MGIKTVWLFSVSPDDSNDGSPASLVDDEENEDQDWTALTNKFDSNQLKTAYQNSSEKDPYSSQRQTNYEDIIKICDSALKNLLKYVRDIQ